MYKKIKIIVSSILCMLTIASCSEINTTDNTVQTIIEVADSNLETDMIEEVDEVDETDEVEETDVVDVTDEVTEETLEAEEPTVIADETVVKDTVVEETVVEELVVEEPVVEDTVVEEPVVEEPVVEETVVEEPVIEEIVVEEPVVVTTPVELSLNSSSVTVPDGTQQTITLYSTSGANISLSPSFGITATYSNGQIIVSADNSGSILVTATKDGFVDSNVTLNVTYVAPVVVETPQVEDTTEEVEEDTTTTTTTTTTQVDLNQYANEVIEIVNKERAAEGLDPLSYNSTLSTAAFLRAEELVESFSHDRPDGSSCFTAVVGYTYSNIGENIAMGQKNPTSVMVSWMNSTGHRENILKTYYTEIGVGVYEKNNTYYWVQFFGNPR